jgi:hypothetical protein
MPIFRRKDCIHTASGIFALELSERSYINTRSTVLLKQYSLISEVIPNEVLISAAMQPLFVVN